MALTFYHVNWCAECQIVREKLEELGLQYKSVIVPDLRPFRKQVFEVSGQYYVPVLKDGDTVLSETCDILSHLETTYGSKAARSSIIAEGGPSPVASEEQRVPGAPLPDPQPER
jgi:glutathione S-transferase